MTADPQGTGAATTGRPTTTGADGRYDGRRTRQCGPTCVGFRDSDGRYQTEVLRGYRREWTATPVAVVAERPRVDVRLDERGMDERHGDEGQTAPSSTGMHRHRVRPQLRRLLLSDRSPRRDVLARSGGPDYYRVRFEPVAPYEGSWPGRLARRPVGRWARVDMWSGESAGDIDARRIPRTSVSGRVTDPEGDPVAGAGWPPTRTRASWILAAARRRRGRRIHHPLGSTPGLTRVRFAGTGALAGEWWNDKDSDAGR